MEESCLVRGHVTGIELNKTNQITTDHLTNSTTNWFTNQKRWLIHTVILSCNISHLSPTSIMPAFTGYRFVTLILRNMLFFLRVFRVQSSSRSWSTIISWFSCWSRVPCVSCNSVHPSWFNTHVHTWTVSNVVTRKEKKNAFCIIMSRHCLGDGWCDVMYN